MPHFCPRCGHDTYICQRCAQVFCDNGNCTEYRYAEWVKRVGNVCRHCLRDLLDEATRAVRDKVLETLNAMTEKLNGPRNDALGSGEAPGESRARA